MVVTITVLLAQIQVSGCIYINFHFLGPTGIWTVDLGGDFRRNPHIAHSITPGNHSATGQPKRFVSGGLVLDVALGVMNTITLSSYTVFSNLWILMGLTITVLVAHIQVSGCIYINFFIFWARRGFEPRTLVVYSLITHAVSVLFFPGIYKACKLWTATVTMYTLVSLLFFVRQYLCNKFAWYRFFFNIIL